MFQGHPGPFRTHVHTTHDEIGYVLAGTGEVRVGGVTRPVKTGDVWVIPANTPARGQLRGRAAGPLHLLADRRSGQPGSRLAGRLMADLLPVIRVPKGSVTPYVLTVGDPDRAAAVGELLDGGRLARPLPRVPHLAGRLEGPRPDGHVAWRRRRRRRRRVRGAHPRRREGHHPPRAPAARSCDEIRLGRPARRDRRRPARTGSPSSCSP